MNNKIIKKLIVIGAFTFFLVAFNNASAYSNGYRVSTIDLNSPALITNYNYPTNINQNNQNNFGQEQPYAYVNQPTNYVQQPTSTNNVQYIPQNYQPATYVPAKSITTTNTVKKPVITSVNKINSLSKKSTGNYVSYDPYNSNMMLASAYPYNNRLEIGENVYDDNGIAALSVAGSHSFMPSSVFQWFLVVLLILAIIIISRMIIKSYSDNSDTIPAH